MKQSTRLLWRLLAQLCIWSLGITVVFTQSATANLAESAGNVNLASSDKACKELQHLATTPLAALPKLAKADVVYLGETHNSPSDHQTQLEIIQQLQRQDPPVAIAMEMFQRPDQEALNRYLAGDLSESDLLTKTEFKQRWGFAWKHYAPIVRFAKQERLPILALNTPTEVTRQVAQTGLEQLTPQQQQYIPPLTEIRTDNLAYRQLIQSSFQQHQQSGHGYSANFERFFLAQVLWDETMAESIAQFIKTHPDYQVVVLAGQGHIVYGYGIPSRVSRRLPNLPLVQRQVLLSPPVGFATDDNAPIANYVFGCNS